VPASKLRPGERRTLGRLARHRRRAKRQRSAVSRDGRDGRPPELPGAGPDDRQGRPLDARGDRDHLPAHPRHGPREPRARQGAVLVAAGMGRARLGHYLLGIEGLALVRDWLVADPACARARVAETRKLLAGFDAGVPAIEIDVPELEVRTGYAAWSETYDATPNPLIRVEEPVVRRLIDETPVGRALDAACGTGRHAG